MCKLNKKKNPHNPSPYILETKETRKLKTDNL